ncbi:MAG: hypothetical protein QOG69_582, partial [Actinomycetota bacterium]|nr:hypothetical protein [Actinomycetota bacterium]
MSTSTSEIEAIRTAIVTDASADEL